MFDYEMSSVVSILPIVKKLFYGLLIHYVQRPVIIRI